jgi:hypothetical protein
MKTKKLALVTFSSVNSFAAATTCTCTVNSAGPVTELNNAATYKMAISLTWISGGTSPSVTTKTFYAPSGYENQFLAVALTAITNGTEVSAMVDFDTTTSTTVYNLSLLP